MSRGTALAGLVLAASLRGCAAYEYEHEVWLRVDGSGRLHVTGRPALWSAFKGLTPAGEADTNALREAARQMFERSGLRVRRVTLTRRHGRSYLFVAADFDDVNRLAGTPAFPDLRLGLRREGARLRLEGTWAAPAGAALAEGERDGLMAVRVHVPSKVYEHRNAVDGVERGNILSWRQEVRHGLSGGSLEVGASLDRRSILGSTVGLFAAAIAAAFAIRGAVLYLTLRRGRT